jgi:RES domain-containing protein
LAGERSIDRRDRADRLHASLNPDETPRVAYRGEAAIALDGPPAWDVGRVITSEEGRWNRPGQPTMYFASDPGVALAEHGRHAPKDGSPPIASLWTLSLSLDEVSDLRGSPDALVLDRMRCRALADELRGLGLAGLIVPSVAFLDNRDRFNVVIFAEILGARASDVIVAPRLLAAIRPA